MWAQRFSVSSSFQWSSTTREQGPQIVRVPQPGLHILSIWIRESGQIVDKIVVAKDAAYVPAGEGPAESALVPVTVKKSFLRGDANRDGGIDLSDPLAVLFHLYGGLPLGCPDAGDADDDEAVGMADAIYLLEYLFREGPAPRPPFPGRGVDPTEGALGCGE
jgi:hypothetical protein